MHSFAPATLAALLLPVHVFAQRATPTVSDLGILQLITPTRHASQFPAESLLALSTDAFDFYTSYTDIDTFNLASAQIDALTDSPKLAGEINRIDNLYIVQQQTSLLKDPKAYLSRLQASASPWPFSATLMSQASGILLGYQSLVSRDLLNAKNVPSVTPGISIPGSPGGAATKATPTAADGTAGAVGSTATSKAIGLPAATGNPQLMVAAAAAAAGMLGIIAL